MWHQQHQLRYSIPNRCNRVLVKDNRCKQKQSIKSNKSRRMHVTEPPPFHVVLAWRCLLESHWSNEAYNSSDFLRSPWSPVLKRPIKYYIQQSLRINSYRRKEYISTYKYVEQQQKKGICDFTCWISLELTIIYHCN